MKRAAVFVVDTALVAAFFVGAMVVLAELERADAESIKAMQAVRTQQVQAPKVDSLDTAARYMTSYDRIAK